MNKPKLIIERLVTISKSKNGKIKACYLWANELYVLFFLRKLGYRRVKTKSRAYYVMLDSNDHQVRVSFADLHTCIVQLLDDRSFEGNISEEVYDLVLEKVLSSNPVKRNKSLTNILDIEAKIDQYDSRHNIMERYFGEQDL